MSLDRIVITPLARITVPGGDVLHVMKEGDIGYEGFGEAYFSWVSAGAVKAWKRHTRMIMNLAVPVGQIKLVFWCAKSGEFQEVYLGSESYCRVTVPVGLWFGFQGMAAEDSLMLNVASIPHDPGEVERRHVTEIPYAWSQ